MIAQAADLPLNRIDVVPLIAIVAVLCCVFVRRIGLP